MKCFYCKKKIDESKPHKITSPDGDAFHKSCYKKFKKERKKFFKETVNNDKEFKEWLGF